MFLRLGPSQLAVLALFLNFQPVGGVMHSSIYSISSLQEGKVDPGYCDLKEGGLPHMKKWCRHDGQGETVQIWAMRSCEVLLSHGHWQSKCSFLHSLHWFASGARQISIPASLPIANGLLAPYLHFWMPESCTLQSQACQSCYVPCCPFTC